MSSYSEGSLTVENHGLHLTITNVDAVHLLHDILNTTTADSRCDAGQLTPIDKLPDDVLLVIFDFYVTISKIWIEIYL